jgi:RHS repeat-associated protein
VYDGESKRAKKTGLGGTTYYFSNEFEIIDNVETKYIFAGNLRIAKVTDVPVYFHKDHLGSSTAMTDGSGSVSDTAMYMPFGGKRGSDEILESNYKFTDQELDAESGLYNYGARLYDPIIGRFLSSDPTIPRQYESQSLNRYSYCVNRPLICLDPTGLYDVDYGGTDSNDGGESGYDSDYDGGVFDTGQGTIDGQVIGMKVTVVGEITRIEQELRAPFLETDTLITEIPTKQKLTPFEEMNEKYKKGLIEIKDEEAKKAILKVCTCLTIGYFSAGVATDAAVRSYGQELCMEKLGGDPFFFDSVHKFDSFYYFSQALRTM